MKVKKRLLKLLKELLHCDDPIALQILRAEINHFCTVLTENMWADTYPSDNRIISVVNLFCEEPLLHKVQLLLLINDIEMALNKQKPTV